MMVKAGCVAWRRKKGSLFCNTLAKILQNLRPAAPTNIILRLLYHQDSQVAIYIDPKL